MLLLFDTGRAHFVFETVGTDALITGGAKLQAFPADVLFAVAAALETPEAGHRVALPTAAAALVAVVAIAPLAEQSSPLVRSLTTIGARLPVPLVDRHVRGLGVVSGQHRSHEQEEITQSPGCQGGLNGRACVARAEVAIADVRMRDPVVTGSRLRVQGHDAVRAVTLNGAQIVNEHLDLKWAQVEAFERDRLRAHLEHRVFVIERPGPELLLELNQFPHQLPHGGHRRQLTLKLVDRMVQPVTQVRLKPRNLWPQPTYRGFHLQVAGTRQPSD